MTRFFKLTAAALAVSALAGPALASDSLARSVGVDAGVYTASQLVQLKAAQDEGDTLRIRQIKAEAAAGGFGGATNVDQIAASIRAEGLSPKDVVALKAAEESDDHDRVFGLRNGSEAAASRSTFSSRGGSAAEQLSASVGVEPGALSLSQLVALKAAQDEGDNDAIHRIMSRVN